tara:strand:+ start:5708 stop:6562 length:855 start_codon:yes stop_codon:yes gene_type:complete
MLIFDQINYRGLKLFHRWINSLSSSQRIRLGKKLGYLVFSIIQVRQKVARENIRFAFPKASTNFYQKTLIKLHRHFGIMLVDALCGAKIIKDGKINIKGRNKLESAYKKEKGIILITGHYGNWELIPIWLAINHFEIITVFKKLTNRGSDLFFKEFRKKLGTSPVYQSTSVSELIRYLRKGKILILASDQNAGKKGEFINFFGCPASTPRGADVLHKKTNATIITAFCSRETNGNYTLKFEKLPDNNEISIMGRFTSQLEKEIRSRPFQYFWFHKRWKSKQKNK